MKKTTMKQSEVKYRHTCAVRHEGSLEGGLYMEFDQYDRCVYSKNSYGFWCFQYYSDEKDKFGNVSLVAHTFMHKYYFLYNPQ